MTSQLYEHPLAELIREISAAGLSGALRLSRERAKVAIYFDAGELVFAASNLRAYRLSECARRWGALSDEQLARAQADASDLEFGAAMVKAGELSANALDELRARQVSEILCHALLWTTGEWEFDPRVRLTQDVRTKIRPRELLMESARRLPLEFVAARFRREDESLAPETQATDGLSLLPTEAFVLTRVDAPLSLRDLLTVAGLPEAETRRVVYTLALGGFLRRAGWPTALAPEEVRRARAVRDARSKPAEVESRKESAPETRDVPAPVKERDEREELEELFARLNIATNFYQILGVVRPAKDADIKRAYHALAKRFHPDRFRQTADETLHARVEAAFAQIAQAYEALKDRGARAAYDTKLLKQGEAARAFSSSRPPSPPDVHSVRNRAAGDFQYSPASAPQSNSETGAHQAEEIFQQGLAALQSGNRAAAIAALGEAARLIPTQPRYRAHYGQALAGDERMRRNAEAELKAAIGLDDKNASYRVMLAEFYNEIGLPRRAQGELERALGIDPRNEPARRLLLKLKGKAG